MEGKHAPGDYIACRSCLSVTNVTLFSIFEPMPNTTNKISDMLAFCSLQLDSTRPDLDKICHECCQKLIAVYDFVAMFRNSQHILSGNFVILNRSPEKYIKESQQEIVSAVCDTSLKTDSIEKKEFETVQLQNEYDIKDEPFYDSTEDQEEENDIDDADNDNDEDLFDLIKVSVQLTESTGQSSRQRTWTTESDEMFTIRSPSNPFHYCPICGTKFRGMKYFERHLFECHSEDDNITCKLCDSKIFDSLSVFVGHYVEAHKYQCYICGEAQKNRYFFSTHMSLHNNEEIIDYECPVENCTKKCRSKQLLRIHMGIHNTEKNYKCDRCNESFKNYDSLRYHKKKHTGPPHLCNYCGKTYWMAGEFNIHMEMHSGIKSTCALCGKVFKHRKGMLSHRRKSCPGNKRRREGKDAAECTNTES